ncbi:putative methylesterase 11, chloroplastic [Ricinus communis]|uniref:Esterase PIR7B, putative n=1 Tax=Ricinus communis TaxID=3988 RepID=B9REC7_RICCO|nr:putative methylesterase 11, chloroplastic [Ricinus communis]EEF50735.1 Esterase PIR7B, putative [Ricinus communis]|eukprot:XP_002512066.1 putative methylesterase 11, chloroplastic [Ricinus communis]
MGNSLVCMSTENKARKKASKHPPPHPSSSPSLVPSSSGRDGVTSSSSKKEINKDLELDEELAEQAIAAAMLFRHHQRNGTLPFPRSTSVVYPSQGSNKKQLQQPGFTKSSSSRQRSLADPLLRPSQLVSQDLKIDDLETKHLILVHGGGFGAWCWYKVIALLEESGLKVDAIDLTGSGTHSSDTNTIKSLSQYVKPLVNIIDNLREGEKVILVGHDIGGACVSYVMELFPSKIAKSIFIAATMLSNGQSAFDILSQQTDSTDLLLLRQAQVFLYGNGKNNPPTAIDLDKALLKDLLFNQSSPKDIALASVSMRPIPFAPILEKVSLSTKNYGSIPRFYIKTQEDCAVPVSLQDTMIKSNPPQQVFQIKGSDHAPFFSKPQALHRILLETLQIPKLQA